MREKKTKRLYRKDSGLAWYEFLKTEADEKYGGVKILLEKAGFSPTYFGYYRNRAQYPDRAVIDELCRWLRIEPQQVPGYEYMVESHRENRATPKATAGEIPPAFLKKSEAPQPKESGEFTLCHTCIYRGVGEKDICIAGSSQIEAFRLPKLECPFYKCQRGYVPTHLEKALLCYFIQDGDIDGFKAAVGKGARQWAEESYDYMVNQKYLRGKGEHKRHPLGVVVFAVWGGGIDPERDNRITVEDIFRFLTARHDTYTFLEKNGLAAEETDGEGDEDEAD